MRQEEAIAVWVLIAVGAVVGVLPRATPRRVLLLPLAGMLLLGVWTALSLLWTDSTEATVAEVARVAHYLGVLVLVLASVTRATWRYTAAGVTAAALAVCALALGSRLAPGTFGEDEVGRLFSIDRLSHPLAYWNAVAAWAVMSGAMALAWSAHASRSLVRAGCLAFVPLCAVVTYLTYSRTGVIGTAFAVPIVIALSRNRWTALLHALVAGAGAAPVILVARGEPAIAGATGSAGGGKVALALLAAATAAATAAVVLRRLGADEVRMPLRAARLAVASGVLAVALAFATIGAEPASRAYDQFRNDPDPVTGTDSSTRLTSFGGERDRVWSSAVRAFRSAPVKGVGAGTFETWWNRDEGAGYILDAHSVYFEQLGELGVPGLLLVLTALGGLAAAALSLRSELRRGRTVGAQAAMLAAFLAYLVHAGVDWMWELTAVSVLALVAGALAASAGRAERRPVPLAPVRVAMVLAAVVAILLQVPGLQAESRVRESREELREGDAGAARRAALRALDAAGWYTTARVQLALVEEATGDLGAAARELRLAIGDEPHDWRHRLLLARVEALRGDVDASLAAYRAARRLRPNSFSLP